MELKEDSYYWLQDETNKLSICCYIGNNEVVFVGCEIKFKLNDDWKIVSEIVCEGKKARTSDESVEVCKRFLCKRKATHNGRCWKHYCVLAGL